MYYNPFASYAYPPIVRDHANVYEIGSHTPVVADQYQWISLSCGFDIVATGRKKMLIVSGHKSHIGQKKCFTPKYREKCICFVLMEHTLYQCSL